MGARCCFAAVVSSAAAHSSASTALVVRVIAMSATTRQIADCDLIDAIVFDFTFGAFICFFTEPSLIFSSTAPSTLSESVVTVLHAPHTHWRVCSYPAFVTPLFHFQPSLVTGLAGATSVGPSHSETCVVTRRLLFPLVDLSGSAVATR